MVTRAEKYLLTILGAGLIYFMAMIVPLPSWWFSVQTMHVSDGVFGQPIAMEYDRTIRREFTGEWLVEVEQADRGAWVSFCTTPPKLQTYKQYRQPPEHVTLEWFAYTEPRCYQLPPGVYRIHAVWVINPGTPFRRMIDAYSNVFEVLPGV